MTAAEGLLSPTSRAKELARGAKPGTPFQELDREVGRLREHGREFARLPIQRKIGMLEEVRRRTRDVADDWVAACCRAKGLAPDATLAGEEWIVGPAMVVRNLRLLIRALGEIERHGAPVLPDRWIRERPGGALSVRVTPYDGYDALMFAGFTAETWLSRSVQRSEIAARQASFYKQRDPEGGVALVLGAGNIASIGSMDVLHKMFSEGQVCALKMNPVNEYLGSFLERAFEPLIRQGYLSIVYGGGDVGAYLCHHAGIDCVHITGSDKTHDEIVWGPAGPARDDRKHRNDPLLKKPITSELGNVSPVLVVPGPYEEGDLANMAENVAGMMTHNASFNCNSAKLLVLPRGWPLRDAFIHQLSTVLAKVPVRKAYYPGARARYEALTAGRSDLRKIGHGTDEALPWTLVLGLDPNDATERNFSTEPFCSILSEVSIGSTDPEEFLEAAVPFANERVWGTLVATIFVHPKTHAGAAAGPAVERALERLRYGAVGINTWPALAYALCSAPWGGYPGQTLADVQSGIGFVNNTVMLEDIEKCIVRGPLRAKPKPIYFPTHRTLRTLGRKLVGFESGASWFKMPSIAVSAFRG